MPGTSLHVSGQGVDVLDQLLSEAEGHIAAAMKGMTLAAANYAVANTPEWSGDMVAQWRIVPEGAGVSYEPSRFKVEPYMAMLAGGNEPFSSQNPNAAAVEEVSARLAADVAAITVEQWVSGGVSLINPHPDASLAMGVSTKTRHPRGIPLLDAVVMFVQTKFAAFATAGQALRSLVQQKVDPKRMWKALGKRRGAGDRKIAQNLHARSIAELREQRKRFTAQVHAEERARAKALRARRREENGG